LVKGGLYLT